MAKKFQNWQDVDAALKQLSGLKAQLDRQAAEAAQEQNALKVRSEEQAEPLRSQAESLTAEIEEFAQNHKAEFTGASRTKKLSWGAISFKLTKKLKGADGAARCRDLVESLRSLGFAQLIKTKEEPNKTALKGLDEQTLAKLGCQLVTEDSVTIKTV